MRSTSTLAAAARATVGVAILLAVGGSAASAGTIGFTVIDVPGGPGAGSINPRALSGDGTTVTGSWRNSAGKDGVFRWRAGTGSVDLGRASVGDERASGEDINFDGTIIGGFSGLFNSQTRAMKWVEGSGFTLLNATPGGPDYDYGSGISDDGSVVVGGAQTGVGYQWVGGGSPTALPMISGATSGVASKVSGNGQVIVGANYSPGLKPVRIEGGVATDLTLSPGGAVGGSALNTNFLGSVVVGNANFGGASSHAFRWTTSLGAMEDLGSVIPSGFSSGRAVSGDGSAVVGVAQVTGGLFSQAAMMWREGSGMVDLNTYLPSIGISTGGMYLYEGLDVSADGLTIMGSGFDAQFGFKGWIVTIPAPGGSAMALVGVAVLARRRRR